MVGAGRIATQISEAPILGDEKPLFLLDPGPDCIVCPANHGLIDYRADIVTMGCNCIHTIQGDVFVELHLHEIGSSANGTKDSSRATRAPYAMAARRCSRVMLG